MYLILFIFKRIPCMLSKDEKGLAGGLEELQRKEEPGRNSQRKNYPLNGTTVQVDPWVWSPSTGASNSTGNVIQRQKSGTGGRSTVGAANRHALKMVYLMEAEELRQGLSHRGSDTLLGHIPGQEAQVIRDSVWSDTFDLRFKRNYRSGEIV